MFSTLKSFVNPILKFPKIAEGNDQWLGDGL